LSASLNHLRLRVSGALGSARSPAASTFRCSRLRSITCGFDFSGALGFARSPAASTAIFVLHSQCSRLT
ncbi:MAG: hypothetical protein K8F24_06095, partial [Bacteroidales bacterium]|nr:hypothetical protein [Bacteroidales bacterium]